MKTIKNIRLRNYDYSSNGLYFITICANYRKPYFVGKNKVIAAKSIESLPQKIKGIKLDYYQVMPTHIHLILILENCNLKLGEIIRRLKASIRKEIRFKLWQPNYYEHVIRNEKALNEIREYIINNPDAEKLKIEEFYK